MLLAGGSVRRFHDAVRLAPADRRDHRVAAELAHADRPDRLHAALGDETP